MAMPGVEVQAAPSSSSMAKGMLGHYRHLVVQGVVEEMQMEGLADLAAFELSTVNH